MIRSHILKMLVHLTARNDTQAEMDRAGRALQRVLADEQLASFFLNCSCAELSLLELIVRFHDQHDRVPTRQEFQGMAYKHALDGGNLLALSLHKCNAEQCLPELNKLQQLYPFLQLSTLCTVMDEFYKGLLR